MTAQGPGDLTGLRPGTPDSGSPAQTVWDAFEGYAAGTPQSLAMRAGRDYTYLELYAAASEVSEAVQAVAPPGCIVAVDVETTAAATVALLGAGRSRCAALPVSREGPPVHRAAVLEEARPAACIYERDDGTLGVTPCDQGPGRAQAGESGQHTAGMGDIAYITYTSGSTGRSKGVVVPHRSLLDRLQALAKVPGFGARDRMLAMATHTFDLCMAETLLPLITGGSLFAAPPATRLDPAVFTGVMKAWEPDVVQATPSFWRLAMANGWGGMPRGRIWCGGEILTPALARRLLPLCAELWNIYGPTEATLWAAAARVTSPEVIDLGRPLPGVGFCLQSGDGAVITETRRPGEIILFGDSLASGYLRRPDLTRQRFGTGYLVDGLHPFYRTGDLAAYREDGTVEFLGRADGQIKLRGYRVELGGLEATAEEHPAVAEAAAILCEADDPRRAHVAMFVVPDGPLAVRDVRQWMAERVPVGVRPRRIIIQPSLPRTPSGKIDRQALSAGQGQ